MCLLRFIYIHKLYMCIGTVVAAEGGGSAYSSSAYGVFIFRVVC